MNDGDLYDEIMRLISAERGIAAPIEERVNSMVQLVRTVEEMAFQRCAEIARDHQPKRFRGGYADSMITSNPMKDIAAEIIKEAPIRERR